MGAMLAIAVRFYSFASPMANGSSVHVRRISVDFRLPGTIKMAVDGIAVSG